MIGREDLEQREREFLSPFATKSGQGRGRALPEEPCEIRTEFQRDRDRILHSKAFRRLMHKTQVFLSPEGDHFRTRLTHTLEVAQIARTIARALGLNEDLTEAIGLGHDLGHTPFGHNGEEVLNRIHPGGFRHNEQSLRVATFLEGRKGENGRGMNLTFEVMDGILNHTGANIPFTLEGQAVKISDRIAYLNHDIDDALRSGVLSIEELPPSTLSFFGNTHRERVNTMVMDVILNSDGKNKVLPSPDCKAEMDILRNFLFKNVYHSPNVKKAEDLNKLDTMIVFLYDYYLKSPESLPMEIIGQPKGKELNFEEIGEAVKDHVAGMTDRYAINTYEKLIKGRQ